MYDVIVVGARCAGASLANFLGQYGYRVLLIDKFRYPGPTLSTHIVGETDVYDRLGIKEEMEAAGAPPLIRMRIDLEGTVFESDMYVTPRAISLRRELLDQLLFDSAVRHPHVKPLLQAKVLSVIERNGTIVGVTTESADGTVSDHYARVVIGADGRNSTISQCVQAPILRCTAEHHLGIYYAYLSCVDPLPIPAVEWYWSEDDVILCNPIDQSMHCIAIMAPDEKLQDWKPNLAEAFRSRLLRMKTLAPRLRGMQFAGKVRGIEHVTSFIKQPYGEGWALVGDAAAHLHPITGSGIDNAVCMSEHLAMKLHAFFAGEISWSQAMQEYARLRDERIIPQFEASLRTLSLAKCKLSEEAMEGLRMLSTFPSFVKKLGARSQDIISSLSEVTVS
jgi:flavin-dependent dehydrogenase